MSKRKSSSEEALLAKKQNVEIAPQHDDKNIHRVEVLRKCDRLEMALCLAPQRPKPFSKMKSSCYMIVHPPLQEPMPSFDHLNKTPEMPSTSNQEPTAETSSTSSEMTTVNDTASTSSQTVTAMSTRMPGTSNQMEIVPTSQMQKVITTNDPVQIKLEPNGLQDSAEAQETTKKTIKHSEVTAKNTDMTAKQNSHATTAENPSASNTVLPMLSAANAIESLTEAKRTSSIATVLNPSTSNRKNANEEITSEKPSDEEVPGKLRHLRSSNKKSVTFQGPSSPGKVIKPTTKKPLKDKLKKLVSSVWPTVAQPSKSSTSAAVQKQVSSVSVNTTGTLQAPTTSPGTWQAPTISPATWQAPSTSPGTRQAPTISPGTLQAPSTTSVNLQKPTTSTGTFQKQTTSSGTGTLQKRTTISGTGTLQRPTTSTAILQKPTTSNQAIKIVPNPPTPSRPTENQFKTTLLHLFRKYLQAFMEEFDENVVKNVDLMLCHVFKYEMKNIANVWKEISDTRLLMSFIHEMRSGGTSLAQVQLMFKHIKYFAEFLKLYCCTDGRCLEYYAFLKVLWAFDASFDIGK